MNVREVVERIITAHIPAILSLATLHADLEVLA